LCPGIWWAYGFFALFLLILSLISKVPLTFILKRGIIISPFVLLLVIFTPFYKENAIEIVLVTFVRAYMSIWVLILLTSTTRFSLLLAGLSRMGIPKIFIVLLSYMYRYFFVLVDEVERIIRAVRMRWFRRNGISLLNILSRVVGLLFIRSYERSERVYYAMVMRGFKGEIDKL